MTYSTKSYEASVRYKAKNIKRIPLDVQVEKYEQIKAAAEAAGVGVNTFIKEAIEMRLEMGR